jgi:hypothetical protein
LFYFYDVLLNTWIYITLFTRVLLRLLGGVIFIIFGFCLLCFTLCPFVTKGRVIFIFWTGNVKDAVNRDSTIQSDVRRFCLQIRRIQVPCQPSGRSSHPVRMPICSCSIRPDDVPYHLNARQTSIIRPDLSTAHPDAHQRSTSFRFFPSSE